MKIMSMLPGFEVLVAMEGKKVYVSAKSIIVFSFKRRTNVLLAVPKDFVLLQCIIFVL